MKRSDQTSEVGKANACFLRLCLEVAFALYLSLLLTLVVGTGLHVSSAVRRLVYFWHPRSVSLTAIDFELFYAELFLIPAITFFGFLRLMTPRFLTRVLRIGGVVAIAGFPLACLYSVGFSFFGLIELLVASVWCLFWGYQKWSVSSPSNVLILGVHYSLWIVLSGSITRISQNVPPWDWARIWDYLPLASALLGFLCSMIWAACFGRLRAIQEQLSSGEVF